MKKMKKILSLVLAMIMVLAVSVPVFAAEGDVTLTINKAAAGHTYEIYQVLVGDVSGLVGTTGVGTLSNVVAGENLVAADATDEQKAAAVDVFMKAISKNNDGKAPYLSDTELAAAASAKIVGTAYKSVDAGDVDSVKTVDVAPGYYVVKDVYTDNEVECAAYMVAVVGDTTMNPKTSIPDIDKNIVDTDRNAAMEGPTATSKKTDTAAIGDVIEYKITGQVPVTEGYKYYYYVVSDTMSDGLTLNADSFVVTIGSKTLAAGADKDYTLTATEHGFKLVVNDMKQFAAGDAITVAYTATVNENAEIGLVPNTNTVHLTYSNNPEDTFDKEKKPNNEPGEGDKTGVTPDKITKTYVTELTLKKVDAETKTFIDALAGAEFTLTGTELNKVVVTIADAFVKAGEGETGVYYALKDGTFTKDAPKLEGDDANVTSYAEVTPSYVLKTTAATTATTEQDRNVTAVVGKDGKIVFTGLTQGTYTLKETKVPTGYNQCADITFTIAAAQDGITTANEGTAITWSSTPTGVLNQANGVFDVTVENQKGAVLPSTGGIGTTIFYVAGAILALGAGVVLVARRRMVR